MRHKPWQVHFALVAALATVSFLNTDSASAISLTNRDARDHKVSVLEGGLKVDHGVKPGETLASVCAKGCIVRLNDSENDEYELEGDEIVSIEDGYLYYDGPADGATAPNAGTVPGNAPGAPVPPPMPAPPKQ